FRKTGRILGIRTSHCRQHDSTITGGASQRPQLIHRPAQCHCPVPAHPTIGWTKTAHPAECRRKLNRSPSFGSDSEGDHRRADSRPRTAGRAARPTARIPGTLAWTGETRKCLVISHAPGELHHAELGTENRSCFTQASHHRCVTLKHLVPIWLCSPGSRSALGRQEILDSIGN